MLEFKNLARKENRAMKSFFYRGFLLFTLLAFLLTPQVNAAEIELSAQAAFLMVADSGQILYQKNPHKIMAPASITKVMTMYLCMEALSEGRITLDDKVTVSTRAWEIGESSMFLNQGDIVTVDQLLKGLSIVSGNDAAIALAEYISGSVEEFVKEMNKKAEDLGLKDSHFANPHGLDAPKHNMSAYDMAMLCQDLYTNYPQVISYYSQKEFSYGGISQESRNPLLGRVRGVDGIKTGFTDDAGYSVVISGIKDDIRLIAVLLGCEDEDTRSREAANLFDYGYSAFALKQVSDNEEVLGEITVLKGKQNSVPFKSAENFSLLLRNDGEDDLGLTNVTLTEVTGPVNLGQELGHLEVTYNGDLIARVPLVAAQEVAKASIFKILWQTILGLFQKIIRAV